MNAYELVGGPLDGETITMGEEHLRVGIPFMCDNGCCTFYELYDWTETSDKKKQLYYAGSESIDEVMFDAEYREIDGDHADYRTTEAPMLLGGLIETDELWDMWEADDDEGSYDD
tara:strand:+ start:552 stop:896 length:345 start_codon:yes stop_codon:yes gene_type:complete